MPASIAGLTEADAIRLFLEQSPQARRGPASERAVRASLRQDARTADPNVAYEIEDAAGVRDTFLTVEQELPITGRRGLLRERADVAAQAAGLRAEADLLRESYALRGAFHEILYRRIVLETLRESDRRLARTVEILRIREKEGEGSGYDVLRAEQEWAELRMSTAEAEAAEAAARARFGSYFDPALHMESAALEGDLSSAGPLPDAGEATVRALERRSDLRALSSERERLDLEQRAARRSRFPTPVLAVGWKRTEDAGISDTGFVAALTVPLPVFDRGRLESARAAAE
ncbi:MAG: TolC family protein, partial [Planctomycetota bacterium]|nr:TolC family protein [Planctomycetota bacterium]